MSAELDLEMAHGALDAARASLDELHASCCEPNRSPRMEALAQTIDQARVSIDSDLSGESAANVVSLIEEAGAQIGSLQVACCTPARMPLYASMLSDLSRSQRAVSRIGGIDH